MWKFDEDYVSQNNQKKHAKHSVPSCVYANVHIQSHSKLFERQLDSQNNEAMCYLGGYVTVKCSRPIGWFYYRDVSI